jgi:hypothetical protein
MALAANLWALPMAPAVPIGIAHIISNKRTPLNCILFICEMAKIAPVQHTASPCKTHS